MRDAMNRVARLLLTVLRRVLVPTGMAATLVTCATNPVTGRREFSLISESQEIAMGQEAAQQVVQAMGTVADSGLQSWMSSLGLRMARASERPNLPWSFTVIDDPAVNAFALPGGPIFITRGILTHMNTEGQLASVLGYEIGHITAKHSVSQMSQAQLAQIGLVTAMIVRPELQQIGGLASQGLGVLFLKFGRDDERQSDDLGFRYMVNAGYAPAEMAEMFRTLQRLGGDGEGRVPEWLSTHPDPGNRVQATLDRIAANPALPAGLKIGRDEFLQRIQGMVFGENPRHGFFRQQSFLHPDFKFQFDFPSGWNTVNQPTQVVAVSPQQDAIVVLSGAGTTAPGQALSQFMSQQGVRNDGTSSSPLNGLTAATGAFTAQTEEGTTLVGRVSFVSLDGQTLRLLGYTSAAAANTYANAIRQSLGSFSRLTDPQVLAVQPVRINLVRLPSAMTVTQFNQAYPSTITLDQLALINGVDATATIPAGTLVKQVK
jgi:predicted Zn-dependent protease